MEKIKLKKRLKQILVLYIFMLLFFNVPLILMKEPGVCISFSIVLSILFGLIAICEIGVYKYLNISAKNYKIKNENYVRSIPQEYSVAIASLIIDNNYNMERDIPAIILSLIGKNFLIFEKNIGKIRINPYADTTKLSSHEEYIYNCIKKKMPIVTEFFKRYVVKDAIEAGLIEQYTYNKKSKIFIGFIIPLIITFFWMIVLAGRINHTIFTIGAIILFLCTIFLPIFITSKEEQEQKNPYKNTPKGNEELYKLKGLERYIKEFSLLYNKETENAILWQDYLAYAYMFEINNKILKEFEYNEAYTNLFRDYNQYFN